jgi:hypothetical protein
MKLEDVLATKGPRAVTVPAKSSVVDAIRTMHAEKVGAQEARALRAYIAS